MDVLYGIVMILFASPNAEFFLQKNCVSRIEELKTLDVDELMKTSKDNEKVKELIDKQYSKFEGACLKEKITMETLVNFIWDFEKYTQWEKDIIRAVQVISSDQDHADVRLYYDYLRKNGEHELLDSQLVFDKKKLSDNEIYIKWTLSEDDHKNDKKDDQGPYKQKGFDIHSGIWYFIKLAENETLVFHFTRIDLHKKYKVGFIPIPEGIVNGKAIEKTVIKTLTDLHNVIQHNINGDFVGKENRATETQLTKNH